MSERPLRKVAIVGGTHGNELTGIYLIKKFQKSPELIQRSTVEAITILGNPAAIAANKRYIDCDLNRCFASEKLNDLTLTSYEQNRAREIAQEIKQEGVDLILDLHTTTSNMGTTIILNHDDPFLLNLVAHLTRVNPEIKILQYSQSYVQGPYLRNLCELGLAIEVGPVPQGVLKAELFHKTEIIICLILDYIEKYNHKKIKNHHQTCTLYKQITSVDYPRNDEGEILGMIAPGIKDYKPLAPGTPMFLGFDGKKITYEGESIVYPVFVGEAAYLEKGIAMVLTAKKDLAFNRALH